MDDDDSISFDDGSEYDSDISFQVNKEALDEYISLMKSKLPIIPPVDISWLDPPQFSSIRKEENGTKDKDEEIKESEKGMSKSEKQNAKKKRRKERDRQLCLILAEKEKKMGEGVKDEKVEDEIVG